MAELKTGLPVSRYVPLLWDIVGRVMAGIGGAVTAARGFVREAPRDGQLYLRIARQWHPGLALTGGRMRGPIRLSRDATEPLEAITKQQADSVDGGRY